MDPKFVDQHGALMGKALGRLSKILTQTDTTPVITALEIEVVLIDLMTESYLDGFQAAYANCLALIDETSQKAVDSAEALEQLRKADTGPTVQ